MTNYSEQFYMKKVRVILRVLFIIFTFCYLYFLQGDLLSLTQKQLSQGQTTYNPLAGAIVLTSLLTLLQYFIEQHITVINRLHACTYALPTIILGLITSLSTCIPTIWIICSITMLILCIVIVWMSKQIEFNETPSNLLFFKLLLPNIWIFIALFTFAIFSGNTDECLHYELKAGRLLKENKPEHALKVGEKSLTTSRRLSALRTFAMKKDIGNKLFEFPMPYGSKGLLLYPADSTHSLFSPDSIYKFYRCYPKTSSATNYYKYIADHPQTTINNDIAKDYYLCALLLDKQIDRFAKDLPQYYNLSDSTSQLPKYYVQALILYKHLRTHPLITYEDAVTTENFKDFLETVKKATIPNTKSSIARNNYGNTYWWYYFFQPICIP